mmetsp:Transcript_25216/g.27952  ORF Transcript_25216/g.27952 Transcript_25216/m.27952 type:complete len:280 (-) Transcript_25216:278-1117(-)
MSLTPLLTSAAHTSFAVSVGCWAQYSAARPATCGQAMEVPEMVLVAVGLPIQLESTLVPGAKMFMQVPKLEKPERASRLSVEPTVKDPSAAAGEKVHADRRLLPAAATSRTPAAAAALTASSVPSFWPPPKDMDAILRVPASLATWLIPAMAIAKLPPPRPMTLMSTRSALRATPNAPPPTVPVQWVPWPLRSPSCSLLKFGPVVARPWKSSCSTKTPVSRTYTVTSFPIAPCTLRSRPFCRSGPDTRDRPQRPGLVLENDLQLALDSWAGSVAPFSCT